MIFSIEDKLELYLDNKILSFCDRIQEQDVTRLSRSLQLPNIYFEKEVRVNSDIFAQKDGRGVFIGAHSYVNSGGYLNDGTFIGRYCSIGRRVSIGAGNYRLNTVSTYPFNHAVRTLDYDNSDPLYRAPKSKANNYTIIENDVWVGDGVVISKGVRIGTGSVIASNAVVTRDIEPYSIVGGVPSKLIRKRFDNVISSRLLKSNWWRLDKSKLESIGLLNVYYFLDRMESENFDDFGFKTFYCLFDDL
jgi:acetyltransferase-like isoleucine patch superfamily enzyme